MTIYDRRTTPIRQTKSKILGGTALTFLMLLCFVNPSWALQVSPSALTFSAISGGTDPPLQTFVLSNNGSRERTWAAAVNAAWITITPSSGTITTETDTVSVRTTAAGLAAGSYSASVTITETSQNGKIKSSILPVTLSITGAVATPAIQLSLSSLAFSGTAGGADPAPKTFSISNTGGGTLAWTASDNAGWLGLSPAGGTNAGTITASVNTAGLVADTYNTTVTISATGATAKTVAVTLTVTATGTGSATLTWNANTEPDLTGYKIYVGTQSGVYAPPITVGKVTNYLATNLAVGTTYFFSLTAYDSAGNESTHTTEVSKSIF